MNVLFKVAIHFSHILRLVVQRPKSGREWLCFDAFIFVYSTLVYLLLLAILRKYLAQTHHSFRVLFLFWLFSCVAP